MLAWRLTKQPYANLTGEGAKLYGGRWNSTGNAVVYAASTLSLALLEQFVRINPDEIPDDFVRIKIAIPDKLAFSTITFQRFPRNWQQIEQEIWFKQKGDKWLANEKTAVLTVPSVIVPEEMNILINPTHPESKHIKILDIRPFTFDSRLLQQ